MFGKDRLCFPHRACDVSNLVVAEVLTQQAFCVSTLTFLVAVAGQCKATVKQHSSES